MSLENSRSADRLAALQSTGLLDSEPEANFDRLTALASRVLHTPVALISLVDRNRQFFKSQVGLSEPLASRRETPLTHSFCQHVAASGEPLVISDARTHELVRDNPAIPDYGVIAYAGMPVSDADGHVLGALCAIDEKPRDWSPEELEILRALAAQANTEIGLRSAARNQNAQIGTLRDFRTPLEAMILGVQALGYLGDWNDAQRECAQLCLRDGKALQAMIEKLLDLAAVDEVGGAALQREPCSPHYLIASALKSAAADARTESVTLDVDASPDLPSFPGDHPRLVRVLGQLVADAAAHTAAGGRVRIVATDAVEAGRPAVIFCVTDGEGEEFVAPSSRFDLNFCRRIVEAHGGRLSRDGTPGHGATSSISLPRAE